MSFCVHGLAASLGDGDTKGIAIGRAIRAPSSRVHAKHYLIAPEKVADEVARVHLARDAAIKDMQRAQHNLLANKDEAQELFAIIDVHLMLLQDDALINGVRHYIQQCHYNAEWALAAQLEVIAAQFDAMTSIYMRERKGDLEQVVERILAHLAGVAPLQNSFPTHADEPLVFIAHDLSPAEMLRFKGREVAGFVTDAGGKTSHTAIVARSLGIPAIVGAKNASLLVRPGDQVIVDANAGVLIVNPSESVLRHYQHRYQHQRQQARTAPKAVHESLQAPNGSPITLLANIELPSDTATALAAGAQGIGLFRTEFLFMGRTPLPSEDEQYTAYSQVVQTMRGLPVTIRTIDIGADKPLNEHAAQTHSHSALGLRAIRWCLADPAMFMTQLKALLRASAHGCIHVLIPMLIHESEIKQVLRLVEQAKAELSSAAITQGEIRLGAMIEVPAAALAIATFLRYFDFLSIGTNDLIQYTLAVDRADESVAHLYDPAHPAVQFLLQSITEQCLAAGKPLSICGEMAGDPAHTASLLAMGLRVFSMHPSQMAAFVAAQTPPR